MQNILDETDILITDLMNSVLYKNYISAREKLTIENISLIKKFKLMQKENNQNDFRNEKVLSNFYTKLLLDDDIRKFLDSELKLTECVKQIYIKLGNIKIDTFD